MKKAVPYAASIAAFSSAFAPALAGDLAVAVSPMGDPAHKKEEMVDVIRLITQTVAPGEQAVIFDGLSSRTICTFAVPNRRSYASEVAKLNANRACVSQLIKFAESANPGGAPGALNVPGTLRAIVKSLNMAEIDAVILFGSPVYDDRQEPSVSMAGGHVPSDGHITAPGAASPYSMAGLEERLQGTPVHFTSDGYDWALNNRHETSVHRFWQLTAETLGGPLATFNADRAQLIERVKQGVTAAPVTFERSDSAKLEMIEIEPDMGRRTPIHQRPLADEPLPASQYRRALDVEVGITWACACDMDIYVRPSPQAEVIFYGNRHTNEGRFYRDYRNGRELLNGLESVSFYAPVNLDEMAIGVNFYSGAAPEGVEGEIRLSVGGKTYGQPFRIGAVSGNEGAGASEAFRDLAAPNERWVMTTGAAIVGGRR